MYDDDIIPIAETVTGLINLGLLEFLKSEKDVVAVKGGLLNILAVSTNPDVLHRALSEFGSDGIVNDDLLPVDTMLTDMFNDVTTGRHITSLIEDHADVLKLIQQDDKDGFAITLSTMSKQVTESMNLLKDVGYDIVDKYENMGIYNYINTIGLVYRKNTGIIDIPEFENIYEVLVITVDNYIITDITSWKNGVWTNIK